MASLTGYRVVSNDKRNTYLINNLTGRGAFSSVYRATRERDSGVFAVKVIEKRKLQRKSLENLLREIEIMRQVHHPNVMSLEDLQETEMYLFIITPFMEKGELFDYIVARGHLTEEDARKILVQILSGIAYLHHNGICHRDLKPENLLCTGGDGDELKIVITDFGFSKLFGRGELMKTSCGTLHYASPEVIKTDQIATTYTQACDMWALGVITYVLLTGCFPFDGPAHLIGSKILAADYCRINLDKCEVSEMARDFIGKLLVVDAPKRMTAEQCQKHPWVARACHVRSLLRLSVENLSKLGDLKRASK